MNTTEIDCVLRRLLIDSKVHFAGVFAADMIPKKITNYPTCFVINTDRAGEPGEHWVAYYADTKSQIEFFDSYGLPVSAYSHIRGLRKIHTYNSIPLQGVLSRTCGHFCIYFISRRAKGHAFGTVVKQLNLLHTSQRDAVVRKNLAYITGTLKITRPCIADCKGSQCCKPRTLLLL